MRLHIAIPAIVLPLLAVSLAACGTAPASAPHPPAVHHVRSKPPTTPPASPLTALRLTVTPKTVTPGSAGDTGASSFLAVLSVTITNPTNQALTITNGQLSTYAPAFSNVDTQALPPAPSLFPLPAGATINYLDAHWGTLAVTIPAHGTVSGTITGQITHQHGPHTLYLMTEPYSVSSAAATGTVATKAPFST